MGDDRPAAWAAYEEAVMAGAETVPEPPEDYEMSAAFQEWLLGKMRVEVAQQIAGSGLDRMAMVKADPDAGTDATSEESEEGGEAEEDGSEGAPGDEGSDEPA